MFRPKRPTPKVHVADESVRKSLAGTRYPFIRLLRRYPVVGRNRETSSKSCAKSRLFPPGCRIQNKREKEHSTPCAKNSAPGFPVKFRKGVLGNQPRKAENGSERIGQGCCGPNFELSQSSVNFGVCQELPRGTALPSGFHRPVRKVCQLTKNFWLGSHHHRSRGLESSAKGHQSAVAKLARSVFQSKSHQNVVQRLQRLRLGWSQCSYRRSRPRILASKGFFAHKFEGVNGGHRNGQIPGEARGKYCFISGQYDRLLLPPKTGGSAAKVQCHPSAIPPTLFGKKYFSGDQVGAFGRHESRPAQQVVLRLRRLHSQQGSVSDSAAQILPFHNSCSRHVQFTGQPATGRLCGPLATCPKRGLQCPNLSPGPVQGGVFESSLECSSSVAFTSQDRKAHQVPSGVSILGFRNMVAPVNQIAHTQNAMLFDRTLRRNVCELSQSTHEKAKMAPSLLTVVRGFMEKQQIPPEVAKDFLQAKSTLLRYDSAFRLLWADLQSRNISPENASVHDVAASIVRLFSFSPAQARNAYTAMLLLPGYGSLRCHPLLSIYKRRWNSNLQKYAVFWDPSPLMKHLSEKPLEEDVVSVRERLLILLRVLCLHRSVDLSRILRTVSVFEGRPFILIRRKGWTLYRWEEVPQVPHCPRVCPWTVLQKYVALTSFVKEGSPLFVSLNSPFTALNANSLGSLTKKVMQKFGIPPEWGPHSTRGAGVQFFKNNGLTSEEVCQIGQWKDVNSFSSHYLRLNAAQRAGESVQNMVHKSSLGECAEPKLSRTPGKETDPGGRDNVGEAQNTSEPTPPPKKREREPGTSPRKKFQFAHLRSRSPPSASDPSPPLDNANSGNSSQ